VQIILVALFVVKTEAYRIIRKRSYSKPLPCTKFRNFVENSVVTVVVVVVVVVVDHDDDSEDDFTGRLIILYSVQ